MDTSKTYIKMCDCPEIQGQWGYRKTIKPNVHDFVHHEKAKYTFGREVWLPRQDQIQEMMEGHKKPDYLTVSFVNFMQEQQKFYKSGRVKKLYPVGSMEQIWLAFYMYEKHKKTWDGKQWKQ